MTELRASVGDTLTFRASGRDPNGRNRTPSPIVTAGEFYLRETRCGARQVLDTWR